MSSSSGSKGGGILAHFPRSGEKRLAEDGAAGGVSSSSSSSSFRSAKRGKRPAAAGRQEITSSQTVRLDHDSFIVFIKNGRESRERATRLLQHLEAGGVEWERGRVRVYGKWHDEPRETAYVADGDTLSFDYSNRAPRRQDWTEELTECKEWLQSLVHDRGGSGVGSGGARSGPGFNSVLCNRYNDGTDCVGWHNDTHKLYLPGASIASFSLGSPRAFQVQSRALKTKGPRFEFTLGHGDILLMCGEMQRNWEHTVPKRAAAGRRINLTFRCSTTTASSSSSSLPTGDGGGTSGGGGGGTSGGGGGGTSGGGGGNSGGGSDSNGGPSSICVGGLPRLNDPASSSREGRRRAS